MRFQLYSHHQNHLLSAYWPKAVSGLWKDEEVTTLRGSTVSVPTSFWSLLISMRFFFFNKASTSHFVTSIRFSTA